MNMTFNTRLCMFLDGFYRPDHPFLKTVILIQVAAELEFITSVFGSERQGNTPEWSSANHRTPIDRQPFTLTFTPMAN